MDNPERYIRPEDWSEEAIAKGAEQYQREIEQRQTLDTMAKRGELWGSGAPSGEIIVEFLRLPDDGAAEFQKKHSGYFPPEFWAQPPLPSDEELYAGTVFLSGPRPSRPRIPYWVAYRDVLRAAWACGFADAYVVRLLNVPTHAEDAEDFFKEKAAPISRTRTLEVTTPHRFQHDILTLVRSTWRAKTCELKSCSQPFVADKPARRFCPERYVADPEFSCYKQYRREYKRDLWKKRGEKWRAATKSKGSRRTRRVSRRTKR